MKESPKIEVHLAVNDDVITKEVMNAVSKAMAAREDAIVKHLEGQFGGKLGELKKQLDADKIARSAKVTR